MRKFVLFAAFCFYVSLGDVVRSQEPQPPQGTQFNTGADPKTEAKLELNRGVEAFREGRHDTATLAFQRAKQLDPQLLEARLYLAATYASEYIPGAASEENHSFGERSVEEFKGALAIDPNNLNALDGIGSVLFQMAGMPYKPEMFLESKDCFLKHIRIKPEDPEPYYWVGVIDWTLSFRGNAELRAKYNEEHIHRQVRDTEPLPELVRSEYARQFGAAIEEGIESLKKATGLRPDYDDAMAYLNLLYRRKADIAGSKAEREQFLKMADDLVDRVMEIKKKRASQP